MGDVAEKKGVPALIQARGSLLHAVCSRDLAKAEDFAARHGAARAYDSLPQMLSDDAVDAVYVATPPFLHCEQTLLCAQARKHVLVEKPMAMNGAECNRMIAACAENGVFLHVAYYRRFWPKTIAVKRELEAGAIGTILGARLLMCAQSGAGWRVQPDVSGGGHFVDVGSHRLDMLQYLCGDVVEQSGFCDNLLSLHAAENDVSLILRFGSRVVASASFHFHTLPAQDVLEIYGSQGTIFYNSFDGASFIIKNREGERICSFETPSPTHLPFVEALIDVYNGADIPHVTGEEGAKTTRLMDTVLSRRWTPSF